MLLPFDRVVLVSALGEQWLTLKEFQDLPLTARLRAVFEKRLRFYRGRVLIDTDVALQAIRAVATSKPKDDA